MTLEVDGDARRVDILPGYWLTVARSRGYKATDKLVEAFESELPDERLVVVGGPKRPARPNVSYLGTVSDEELRWLYQQARALVSVSREDFGLTPVEANAFGTPALVLQDGGFLDTLLPGVSGKFIRSDAVDDIVSAVKMFPLEWDVDAVMRNAERFSTAQFRQKLLDVISAAGSRRVM